MRVVAAVLALTLACAPSKVPLVQHASHDTTVQAAMLVELDAAFERGEADGQSIALFTDRAAVQRGQPQVYGTQADMRDGRLVLEPIAGSWSMIIGCSA